VIIILSKDRELISQFENYDELFEFLAGTADTEFMAVNHNAKDREWRFTIYPPQRVEAFFSYLKDSCEVIKEAIEESLPLIEICAGNFKTPFYIALTANINMGYLKRKWCIDWCTFYHLLVGEV